MRLRARAWLIVQIAVGAALAWWIARHVVGHVLPFFAPVTAMVCLGLTYGDRIRRIIELTVGVAIGILTADVFVQWFGSGTWQILLVAGTAMSLAVLLGAGQLLMMQAGIQGVLVTTLVAPEGAALSRWVDALVGGSVALVIAMLAPTRSTTQRPRERAVAAVGHLAAVLTDTTQALRTRDLDRARGALTTARKLSEEVDALRDATAEAGRSAWPCATSGCWSAGPSRPWRTVSSCRPPTPTWSRRWPRRPPRCRSSCSTRHRSPRSGRT